LVIQVQGKFYKGSRFEFVSWGIHNDLWLIAANGKWAQRLVETEYLGAALHPHFSDTGDRLFWTVRESTGKKIRQRLFHKTPGTWEEHGEPSPKGSLVTFNSSRSFDWKNPPDTARTLRLELWARRMSTGDIFRLTDFNKQLIDHERVLTSDYAWSPFGREIAVYYATFGRDSITQKIDILRLDRAY
jgi:hypothetical protein